MSRFVVTGIFLALVVPTAIGAVERVDGAVDEAELHYWLIASYWALKTAVISAFTIFVFARGPARQPSRETIAFAACAAAILTAVALQPPGREADTALVLAGEALALAGAGWMLWSVLALGTCFGVLPEARGLVTSGPYQIVRHPVYLGEFAIYGGLVLAAPGLWNLGVAIVFAVSQATRMRLEEQALELEFPEYAAYAARTPRLVPRLGSPLTAAPQGGGA
jgi:protein-S-isoprenylcysteine O-methyltransferase Ste14